MTYSLTWLPGVLRAAGLKVVEESGWQNRGHGDMGTVQGILCHHTCGPKDGDIKDIGVLINGRPDLAGPLCHLGLARSGTFHIVAAGKAWHAGRGFWRGVDDGNSHLIGIEAENTGETTGPRADPWPDAQMEAYARGCAAILKHVSAPAEMCAGHKEYALPKGRKDDPSFAMEMFRGLVRQHMGAVQPAPAKVATVTIDNLNFRAEPSISGAIIGVLHAGEKVTPSDVTSVDTNRVKWVQVTTASGKTGWLASRFLKL